MATTGSVSLSFKTSAVDSVTLAGRTRLGRVQNAEFGTNLPNTLIQELGSDRNVGRVYDLADITVTVNAIDVGARNSFALAGIDWASVPSGTYIELQDMKYTCLVESFKSLSTDDIAQTLFVPGAKLNRVTFNYAVGSDATEEYQFNGTDRKWLKYDVAVASGVTATSGVFTFSPDARVLKDGSYILAAFASGIGYLAPEVITASTATTATFDSNTVADGTPVLVAYHADLSNQWDYTYQYPHVAPDYTPPPDQPVGMRGFGAEIYLVKSGQSNNRVYRAQTLNLQAQYQTTKVQELGTESVVGYSDGVPDITGTLEILLHDFLLQQQLAGDTVGDNWTPNELGNGEYGILVELYRRGVDRAVVGPEKSVFFRTMEITGETDRSQVGSDTRQSWQIAVRDGNCYICRGAFTALPW